MTDTRPKPTALQLLLTERLLNEIRLVQAKHDNATVASVKDTYRGRVEAFKRAIEIVRDTFEEVRG